LSNAIPLYVPHTRMSEATEVFLRTALAVPEGMEVHKVDVTDNPWGYPDHLRERWAQGESFINMEHDIVPWPGALHRLIECPEPWCFYGYQTDIDFAANGAAPFGLVKFGSDLIATIPDVWTDHRAWWQSNFEKFGDRTSEPWVHCDNYFVAYVKERGLFTPHQHYPAVLNANPLTLEVDGTTNDGHKHLYEPYPNPSPGVPPVLVCVHPGCQSFLDVVT